MIRVELELKLYDNGGGHLNFWDYIHGRDVIATIDEDNKLYIVYYDKNNKKVRHEITFSQYIELVRKSIKGD